MNNEQLLEKILQLEERIKVLENQDRTTLKKDKKENKLDWLNNNKNGIKFKEFYQSIEINEEDIDYLFHHNFTDTISYILIKYIRQSDKIIIWCFKESKSIYIFNQSWKKMDTNDINDVCYYFNTQLFNKLFVWANSHKNNIFNEKKKDSEILAINAKKLSDSKIYYTDFRKDIYNNLSRLIDD